MQSTESLVKTIKAHIAKGDKAADKAEQHYVAAGQHLKTLKAQHDDADGTWAEWEALLKQKVGIGKSRASELMQIADGRKTVEDVRADTAKRMAEKRALQFSPSRDGEDAKASASNGEFRMPEISVSQEGGKIKIKITEETDPLCPNAACSNCGSNLRSKVYECQTAEEVLSIIQEWTDPEFQKTKWDIGHLLHLAEGSARELAQWLSDHPQYSEATVAEWLERDEDSIRDMRRWAKNGFKGEMPLWIPAA